MLKAIACDDEPLAAERLSDMLAACDDVELLLASTDSSTALAEISRLRPDLVLLDIEMPGLDGFDVVERLGKVADADGQVPLVIFVTAHPRFASQAFETGAVDFLEKPVRLSRLQMAIARARKAIEAREPQARLEELQRALDELRKRHPDHPDGDHVWIHKRGEFLRIDLADLSLIRAEGEYVRLFAGNASHLYREAIGTFQTRLDEARHIRIHRSIIVRIDEVAAIRRSAGGTPVVRLKDGQDLPVGRKYAKAARAALMRRGPQEGHTETAGIRTA